MTDSTRCGPPEVTGLAQRVRAMLEQEAHRKIARWADEQLAARVSRWADEPAGQHICAGCGTVIYRLSQSNTWACASLEADDPTDCWRGEPQSEPVPYGHYPEVAS